MTSYQSVEQECEQLEA